MATIDDLRAFTNKVYLVIKGRYFDDLTSDDGANLVNQTIDWANMFMDELELETTPDGQAIDWWFARQNDATLGKARVGRKVIDFDSDFNNLIAGEERYVLVTVDGQVVSSWSVVNADQLGNRPGYSVPDRVARVGQQLVFSREFRDNENGGTITGDVTAPLPRLSLTNADALTGDNAIVPQQLLILGAAKDASLPDIVQGKLSPSYAQRYANLLEGAKARSAASSNADTAQRDNYSNVRGVY